MLLNDQPLYVFALGDGAGAAAVVSGSSPSPAVRGLSMQYSTFGSPRKSVSRMKRIPSFSITRIEARCRASVSATTRAAPEAKARSTSARAPSVARPRPHAKRCRR